MNAGSSSTALALPARGDVATCRSWIAEHSKSFYLSSLLLPERVRHGAWVLYAFCRRADDTVDDTSASSDVARARVASLGRRLDEAYDARGLEAENPIDRSFALLARRYAIPRALPQALLDGMEMDLAGTRYRDWDDLYLYCFRVASVVGLMMTRLMGWSRDDAFLRAADLGVAMQMTNIARDVGEDALRGRVYLPDTLLAECGTDRARVIACSEAGKSDAPLRAAVEKLLARADAHYRAADRGVPLLPRGCRLAIAASRRIYAAIGDELARQDHDPLVGRAHTSLARKLWLVARSLPRIASRPTAPAPGPADAILDRLLTDAGLDAVARSPSQP